jgi:hypothetical protein
MARPLRREAPGEGGKGPVPGVSFQKTFIMDNAKILDHETRLAILSIVMMEIGSKAVFESGANKEVDINLDVVAEENDEVLTHVYNIVRARRETLSQPAGGPTTRNKGGPPAG